LLQSFPDSIFLAEYKLGGIEISARISLMKMITKLRKLKLLLHLEKFMDLVQEKCSEELLPQSSSDLYAIC
jgi:hypothetical protein